MILLGRSSMSLIAVTAIMMWSVAAAASDDCIQVPDGGWTWKRFKKRLVKESKKGNEHVVLCGPFTIRDDDTRLTTAEDIPNIRSIEVYGGMGKVETYGIDCSCTLWTINSNDFGLKGLHFNTIGGVDGFNTIEISDKTKDVVIENCIFEDHAWEQPYGLIIGSAKNVLIDKCTFYNNQWAGIHLSTGWKDKPFKNIRVRNSLFIDNKNQGIEIYSGNGAELTVEGSAFAGNAASHDDQEDFEGWAYAGNADASTECRQTQQDEKCLQDCMYSMDLTWVGDFEGNHPVVVNSYLESSVKGERDCYDLRKSRVKKFVKRIDSNLMRHCNEVKDMCKGTDGSLKKLLLKRGKQRLK